MELFYKNDTLLKLITKEKPAITNFYFGLPDESAIRSMKEKVIYLIASATSLKKQK